MHVATFLPNWNSLDSVRRAHSELEFAALASFALLVMFDVLAHLTADKNNERSHLFERIGLLFFAIAVLADIVAYPYGQRNDTLSAQMIDSLDEEARDASVKAKRALADSGTALDQSVRAQNKVDSLSTEADVLDRRMDSASAELDTLKQEIRTQGPRWRLIEEALPRLVKQLEPFAGQKVGVFVCGDPEAPRSSRDEETMTTWSRVAWILEGTGPKDKGANWSMLHGGLTFWPTTLGCAGIAVFVSSEASKKTMEAAKVLGAGLAKALPPFLNKLPGVVEAESSRLVLNKGFEPQNAPWRLVTSHPDVITVMIGPHRRRPDLCGKWRMLDGWRFAF